MNEVTVHRMPWEIVPVEETVAMLQRDFAYAVLRTAVMVRSTQPALRTVVNTLRGQIVPNGVGRFTDGTTVEFADIGMPQPGAPEMTVEQLVKRVADAARELGLVPL
jgi:hypothetical protein